MSTTLSHTERIRQWRSIDSNRLAMNAQVRARYQSNKARFKATARKYKAKIREVTRTDRRRWALRLWNSAKVRARRFGLDFNLQKTDVVVPDLCPVLGMVLKLNVGRQGPDSATLDRIDPVRGYVAGNVIVVSLKANAIKSNATPDEILKVGLFYSTLAKRPE